ncbi:hypothetical protein ScPMuIL_004189 [Solemya velum]
MADSVSVSTRDRLSSTGEIVGTWLHLDRVPAHKLKIQNKSSGLPELPSHQFEYSWWHDVKDVEITGDQKRAPRVRRIVGFLEYQVETVLGVLAALIGVVLIFAFNRSSTNNKKAMQIVSEILFIFSGVASWIPVGKFSQFYALYNLFGHMEFPYSLVLTGIGATLAFITAFLVILLLCKRQQGSGGQVIQSTVYPMQPAPYPSNAGYSEQGYANQPPPPPAKY